MRQLPLHLRLQQLIDGELPDRDYRDIDALRRAFHELDELDRDSAADLAGGEPAPEELDELLAGDDPDVESLLERKRALEETLFEQADHAFGDGEEIQPLRELLRSLSEAAGGGARGPRRQRRLQRLARQLESGPTTGRGGRLAEPGGENVVAVRRRRLLKEFREAWIGALQEGPRRSRGEAPEGAVPDRLADDAGPLPQPRSRQSGLR